MCKEKKKNENKTNPHVINAINGAVKKSYNQRIR